MIGWLEQIVKVLCMGIFKMVINENCRAYLINFFWGIKILDFYNIVDFIDEIVVFLCMFFYGGMDVSLVLYEIIWQFKGNDYEDVDVFIIFDFIMYKIDDDVLCEVCYFQQNKGM